MPEDRAGRDLFPGGGVLKDGSLVWRVGHVAGPIDFPPDVYLPDPRTGRFDDPLQEYRTLYANRFQRGALRETLQNFRRDTATTEKLKTLYGAALPPPRVPADWRARHVLAPARVRLRPGAGIANYEDPALLRELEDGFAAFLSAHGISNLDIPALRSKDRIVSQHFGRMLFERGYGGILFRSSLPPSSPCVALFEDRAWLEPAGPKKPLSGSFPALRTVCKEFGLQLS